MQIAYHAKYPQLVCVILLSFNFANAAQIICGENNSSAEFENNFNIILKNLVNNTSSSNRFNTSSYGKTPDKVYGLLQCREDTTAKECFSCSQDANTTIRDVCKNARGGRYLLGNCFIRYENYSFFGILDTKPRVTPNKRNVTEEPDVFKRAVTELFNNLTEIALQSSTRYSSGLTRTTTLYPINGELQCWRDLTSVEDCRTCIGQAIRNLLDVTFTDHGTLQGGAPECGSCFARYDTYPFFNPAPPPPPSPIKLLSPTATKSSNKLGIVLGIVAGSLVMLLLCLFAIRRKFKFALSWKQAVLRKVNLDSEVDSAIGQEQEIIFNLENIKAATSNFHEDNKLGEGGFGSVYKGTMPNGLQIAVKRLSVQSSQGKKQFLNEIKLVAKIQHRNLVNLL
ncbi:cysteine-rich repeat secretory protein 55-like [Cryptomeria japonica]|uniref:cysteine-rich repeat secretory protein 55-like n=1 Tax=Cryptomeria japonica TaxID=3369 RepID=UPI0027DA1F6C|nr:cysteine-rich repeat secretory protein 55-like [Cryptomeria japonica]